LLRERRFGEGIAEMQRIADKLLDSSFTTALSGPSRDFAESNSNISFALILALLLIYLILAAQFESFRDPFIINAHRANGYCRCHAFALDIRTNT